MSPRPRKRLLGELSAAECAVVLRSLLERHSELEAEAEEIARVVVADVDAEAVAEDVEQAVLGLDLEDLSSQAGPHTWGYVEPTEAAWEMLWSSSRLWFRESAHAVACRG